MSKSWVLCVRLGEGMFPDVRDKTAAQFPPSFVSASREISLYGTKNLKILLQRLEARDRKRFSLLFGGIFLSEKQKNLLQLLLAQGEPRQKWGKADSKLVAQEVDFGRSGWLQEASGSEGPAQFAISQFFIWTFMEWELIDVWVNTWPGHETSVNSLHPIISFLKKVPPLIDQNETKEQEIPGSVRPVHPSLSVASWVVPALT